MLSRCPLDFGGLGGGFAPRQFNRYTASRGERKLFGKYTEKARRVIFFARYEVSQLGAQSIGTEHLLLGLLREDKALLSRFLPDKLLAGEVRRQIDERIARGAKIATSVEIPLSDEAKEALKYAAEESESLGHKHIGPEHLLLGLLRMKSSLAEKVLHENGVSLSDVRRHLTDQDK